MTRAWLLSLALAGCASPAPAPNPPAPQAAVPRFRLASESVDGATADQIADHVAAAIDAIEPFFGVKLPRPFEIRIAPDRRAVDAIWRVEWEQPPEFASECWMVGSGDDDTLVVLSPRVWRSQACEHDPDDEQQTRLLLTHEVIHVLHHQLHPRRGRDLDDATGWFVEGVAVFGSGQLTDGHLASAREAIAAGAGPIDLEHAWAGKYRYGISGSLVSYVDACWGRAAVVDLMRLTTEAEILGALGVSESDLLGRWAAWVREPSDDHCHTARGR